MCSTSAATVKPCFLIVRSIMGPSCFLPTVKVTPRDAVSEAHIADYARMDPPKDNEEEYVFLHRLKADEKGETFAAVVDDQRQLALQICFNQRQLPYFMEWKSMASGDYVLGLEPSNSSVYGKLHHIEQNSVHYLEPFEKETNTLKFSVVEGREKLEEMIQKINALKAQEE